MMAHIKDFQELPVNEVLKIVNQNLGPKIRLILNARGDLPKEGIKFFLETNYATSIGISSLEKALSILNRAATVKERVVSYYHTANACTMYTQSIRDKRGNELRRDLMPVPESYAEGYYQLYVRYQAIRGHPELATAAEEYIDALYNPQVIGDDTQP